MIDLETDHEFNWTREKFINRKFVMQEMFENYTDGDEWQLPAVGLLTLFLLWKKLKYQGVKKHFGGSLESFPPRMG